MVEGLAFIVLFMGWAVLPLIPALRELHRPTDATPLNVEQGNAADLRAQFEGAFEKYKTLFLKYRNESKAQHALFKESGIFALAGPGDLSDQRAQGNRVFSRHRKLTLSGKISGPSALHAEILHLENGSEIRFPVYAAEFIELGEKVSATVLQSPTIRARSCMIPAEATLQGLSEPRAPENAQWLEPQQRWQADDNARVPAQSLTKGDLVCKGSFTVEEQSIFCGAIKAKGTVHVQRGATIKGSIVAERVILAAESRVFGCVVADESVIVGEHARIGAPPEQVSVVAPTVTLCPGAVVHGGIVTSKALKTA